MNTPKILAIGDTVVDAFIELSPDVAQVEGLGSLTPRLSLPFADKAPFVEDTIVYGVGNSANAAVSAARLGIDASLLTHLGDDENGQKSLESLRKNGVTTTFCSLQNVPTNYHYVLWLPPERTILVKHEHFNYNLVREIPQNLAADWIYLSSIGGGTEMYHDDIATWIENNPNCKLAFQPGTFQMKLGVKRLQKIYTHSELFFCNVEEALRITDSPAPKLMPHRHTSDFDRLVHTLCERIHTYGPRVVVITDGPEGAYASTGDHMYYHPIYPDPKPPRERTGAGDAYASTFTAFYALGFSVEDCMRRAPINSMNVVQYVGAQRGLLSLTDLEHYLANAPEDYHVRAL